MAGELTEYLQGVIGLVEANSYERHALWKECKGERTWKETGWGLGETVGHLADTPVFVSLLVDTVDGHRILFWHATSQVVDHRMIEAWLTKTMPRSAFTDDGGTVRLNKVDAMNFHNVFPRKAVAA